MEAPEVVRNAKFCLLLEGSVRGKGREGEKIFKGKQDVSEELESSQWWELVAGYLVLTSY